MKNSIALTIDGRSLTVPEGTTILDAAAIIGVGIPTICHHPALKPPAVCRICSVEVEDRRTLQPGCAVPVAEGMVVKTNTERVKTARKVILELLASTTDLREAPEIQELIEKGHANARRFEGGMKRQFEVKMDNPFFLRDYSQCIMCWRCIQVCADEVQNTYALTWGKRGVKSHITTFFDDALPDTACVFCGNCVGVCPTGALKGLAAEATLL